MFDQWVFRGSYASHRDSVKFNYQIGYDVLIESASGRRILDLRQQQADFALFATAEYEPIPSIIIRPGLRYAYNTTYPPPILPSLNVKWQFAKKWNLRASYAQGFRSPGIKELYFEFVDINHNILGNDSLNAENSNNFLSSITHKFENNKWSLESELNGFYNSIANRITLAGIQGTEFTYVNIGEFQSTGIRFTTKFIKDGLTVNGGIGWIGSASNIVLDELSDNFLFYPEVQTSIIYSFPESKTSLALFYKYQGALPNFTLDNEGNTAQRITEDYHLLDFTVTQQFCKNRLSLTLGSKNILNVTQVLSNATSGVHSGGGNSVSVGTGRTYFASLKLNLKKPIKRQKK
jgi:outer membrane receptor for ferrienterochelin and colicins